MAGAFRMWSGGGAIQWQTHQKIEKFYWLVLMRISSNPGTSPAFTWSERMLQNGCPPEPRRAQKIAT
jgi:hypothetical protein